MNKNIIYGLIGVAFLFAACSDRDKLTPSTDPEPVINENSIPQGNNDYDYKIVELYGRYGSVILYTYDYKEFWWDVTEDLRWSYNESTGKGTGGYEAAEAVQAYVPVMLELLDKILFRHYSDVFLRKALPVKILLASDILKVTFNTYGERPDDKTVESLNLLFTTYGLTLGKVSENIRDLTSSDIAKFQTDLNYGLIKRTNGNGITNVPDEFYLVSTGFYGVRVPTAADAYAAGFLSTQDNDQNGDIALFIQTIISIPYEELISETGTRNYLHSSKDTKGRIRQKYDILINHYLTKYDIDLQAIGNSTLEL